MANWIDFTEKMYLKCINVLKIKWFGLLYSMDIIPEKLGKLMYNIINNDTLYIILTLNFCEKEEICFFIIEMHLGWGRGCDEMGFGIYIPNVSTLYLKKHWNFSMFFFLLFLDIKKATPEGIAWKKIIKKDYLNQKDWSK